MKNIIVRKTSNNKLAFLVKIGKDDEYIIAVYDIKTGKVDYDDMVHNFSYTLLSQLNDFIDKEVSKL